METRTVEQVEDWEEEPFPDGYGGLRDLADREFSGAVRAGNTWLFMLNGRAIGVFGRGIDAFDGTSGTAYAAPHPALPLLFTMWERGGETRAQYYTEDTPLSEVDRTLSDGGFTGYVELSENVLSGDYYVVYQAGNSMSVAFLGESGRLITDDEAFERAADEVGVYEVRAVDIDVIDIPGPGTGAGAEPAAEAERAAGSDAGSAPDPGPDEAGADGVSLDDYPDVTGEDELLEDDLPTDDAEPFAEPELEMDAGTADASEPADPADAADAADATAEAESPELGSELRSGNSTAGDETEARGEVTGAGQLEVRSIPALDPERTRTAASTVETEATEDGDSGAGMAPSAGNGNTTASSGAGTSAGDVAEDAPATELQQTIEEHQAAIDRLQARLEEAESTRDGLQSERDELEAEVTRLREQLEEIRAGETADAGAAGSPGATTGAGGRSMSAEEVLAETNLFVRYNSKSDPTLQAAHAGEADREAVKANLDLEHHTQFDAESVTVNGRDFESFLEDTIECRFVAWLIEDLLYELQETGNVEGLRDLYDALPKADRVELDATVGVEYLEDGETHREQLAFDTVVRDRMGNPLVVANINDARDPADEDMMTSLITDANRVGESHDSFAAAFLLTASFFEPGAMSTATEATGGSLLSRDRRRSFVKLSRKHGYHLCLVEARNGKFHLSVPEL